MARWSGRYGTIGPRAMAPFSAIVRQGIVERALGREVRVKSQADLVRVNQPMLGSEKQQFQAVRDSKLVKNICDVVLRSVLTNT